MENLQITKIFKSNKDKEGKPFKDKNGKPFWKVAVKFSKYGDTWYSTLAFREDDPVLNLEEGQEKLFVIDESNGYKNFKLPTKYDVFEAKLDELNRRVRKLENNTTSAGTPVPFPEDDVPDINPEDIPF